MEESRKVAKYRVNSGRTGNRLSLATTPLGRFLRKGRDSSHFTVKNKAITVRIAKAKLARSPRCTPDLSSLIHRTLIPILLKERIWVINNNSNPQPSGGACFEVVFVLPLHMQAHAITTDACIVLGIFLIPKIDLES